LWLAVVLAGLVVFVGVGWWVLENLGLRHLSAVDLAYARLLRMGTWLGCPSSPADTPHEWARVACIAAPGARASIDEIVDLYTRAHFAGRSTSYVEAQMAWQRARPILWRSWFRRLLSWPQRWHG